MTKSFGSSTKNGSKKCSNSKPDSLGEAKTETPSFHKVIVLLVTSRDSELVQKVCVEKLGFSETDAKKAIERAKQEIAMAAEFDRREQIGKAIVRLEDIYEKSMRVQEQKTALASQKELSKLLGLYPTAEEIEETSGDENDELTAVRQYLLPLDLGSESTPTVELVRLATYHLQELLSAKNDRQDIGGVPKQAARRGKKKS